MMGIRRVYFAHADYIVHIYIYIPYKNPINKETLTFAEELVQSAEMP